MPPPTRREFLRAVGAGAVGAVAGCVAAGRGGDPAWPAGGYDAANTGHNSAATGPREGVAEAWTRRLDRPTVRPPVVADGRAYAGVRRLHAFDAATGLRDWTFDPGEWPVGAPASAGGTVYVCADALHALDPHTGEERWRFSPFGKPRTGPAVVGETAYVATGGTPSTVVAVDVETGEKRWETDTAARVDWPFAVGGGRVVYGARDGTLEAFASAGGRPLWRTSLDTRVHTSPTLVDAAVFVAGPVEDPDEGDPLGRLYALDAASGRVRWETSLTRPIARGTRLAATGEGVFVGSGADAPERRDGALVAFDAAAGKERWRREFDAPVGAPSTDGETVYATDRRDALHAVDVATGEERWRTTARTRWGFLAGGARTPVVAGDRLYLTTAGRVLSLREGSQPDPVEFGCDPVLRAAPAGAPPAGCPDDLPNTPSPVACEPSEDVPLSVTVSPETAALPEATFEVGVAREGSAQPYAARLYKWAAGAWRHLSGVGRPVSQGVGTADEPSRWTLAVSNERPLRPVLARWPERPDGRLRAEGLGAGGYALALEGWRDDEEFTAVARFRLTGDRLALRPPGSVVVAADADGEAPTLRDPEPRGAPVAYTLERAPGEAGTELVAEQVAQFRPLRTLVAYARGCDADRVRLETRAGYENPFVEGNPTTVTFRGETYRVTRERFVPDG
ncbi:MAG: PQQ-binding-like beta-propeller repeat protein [Halobacteriaceae archaeon]